MKNKKTQFLGQQLFKCYIKYIHEMLLIRHRYVLGKENLPAENERYMIVCNHQNTANDPLNIIHSLPIHYKIYVMARANVFEVNKGITKFLNWLGLIPAFRAGFEGSQDLDKNYQSFNKLAEHINSTNPVVVFPEVGHTQGHYLDPFSTGAVRMAFYAAKANDWKEDVKIVPTAHHYSDYFKLHSDFMWQIGQPISLKPYYTQYQEHPYKVMREITHKLRDAVQSMMLDEGAQDYLEKDWLRNSAFNPASLQDMPLPERLKADQQFIARLKENPNYDTIISHVKEVCKAEQEISITDDLFANRPSLCKSLLMALVMLVLLPCWILALVPNVICYWLPTLLLKTDKMFTNSYRYIMTVVLLYPIFALIALLILGLGFGLWWQTIVWILLWAPLGRFGWWYWQALKKNKRCFKFMNHKQQVAEIEEIRKLIRL